MSSNYISNVVAFAAAAALAALPVGIVFGFARVESGTDLLLNVRWSPWLLAPVGLAATALLLFLLEWMRMRFSVCIPGMMTFYFVVALLALAAPFAVVLVVACTVAYVVRSLTRSR